MSIRERPVTVVLCLLDLRSCRSNSLLSLRPERSKTDQGTVNTETTSGAIKQAGGGTHSPLFSSLIYPFNEKLAILVQDRHI